MFFELLQEWRLHHLSGQPVPMLDHPFSTEIFPNIQSKPLLTQLEAIFSRPITSYFREETDTHLSTTSFQVTVESSKISPQPLLLQAKQSQFPQLLLIRLVLQTLHHLPCPSLDTLQHLNVPLVVGGPKLNTVFEVWPHQCRVQGHDHFPTPAGHTISDTSQDAVGFFGHLGTLLAHVQPAVNQHSQVLLCWAAFQPLFPKPVALHGVVVTQVQDLALGLVKPHTIDLVPSIQAVQIPLQSLPTLKCVNGKPVLKLDNPFCEKIFPNIQSKPALEQLEAISSCPIACYLGEETDPHLSTTSFQAVVESNKVSPQPPFLQAKQPQFPQLFLTRLTLRQLRCPSLNTLQHLHVSLVVRGPKLNTAFEGHDQSPGPAGHTISDTSQDAVVFLGHPGTLLAHIQMAVNQHPQVPFRQAAFQPLFLKPVALHGIVVTQGQDPC
ncbi:LOW QUALITY PROTEIN: hypothetical protein QYF61_012030 [Mycteria americana]|uniref:Uncharacterized protein n=1 Tax=Mycteria americana TaxID=33587 RepID=A0AAN7NUA6_MYCAM|nr:LOW QUALITY PROTEIN: hypothetical protein QYF61_012030 [Mycteria americana]